MQGSYNTKWQRAKKAWRRANPPDEHGNYTCALCGQDVPSIELSLDHILPDSYYPKLAYDLTNLQPTHEQCNREKGNTYPQVEIKHNNIVDEPHKL